MLETSQAIDRLSPFIGPRPFDASETDKNRFFGRHYETQRIVSYIISSQVVLLYAPSGAGKTSLMNASIIPAIKKKGVTVLPFVRVKNIFLNTDTIGKPENQYIYNTLMCLSASNEPGSMINRNLPDYLGKEQAPRLIVFDQFEELFVSPINNWKKQQQNFFVQVQKSIEEDSLLRVVFVIREDYIGDIEMFSSHLEGGFRIRFRLESLSKPDAIDAFTGAFKLNKIEFKPGLVEQLINDMSKVKWRTPENKIMEYHGDAVEPVQLQLIGSSIYNEFRTSNKKSTKNAPQLIETDHLTDICDVNTILENYYQKTVSEIAGFSRRKEKKLRKWVDKNLITTSGTRGTVFRVESGKNSFQNQVINKLLDKHVIVGEERAGARWYELSHDRWIDPIKNSNTNWNKKHAAISIIKYSVLLLAIIITIAAYKVQKYLDPGIVPKPSELKANPTNNLPATASGRFNILKDIRVIDLRSRKKLNFWETKHGGPYSPVTWLRYTMVKKNPDHLDEQRIIFKYATSGFAVYPRALTHKYELFFSRDKAVLKKLHPNMDLNEAWRVSVDVAEEKQKEFLIVTEATFWNAFQRRKEGASINAVDINTASIGITLLFPENNPYTDIELVKHNIKTGEKMKISMDEVNQDNQSTDPSNSKNKNETYYLYRGKGGEKNSSIFWLVKNPKMEYRYDIKWQWDQ